MCSKGTQLFQLTLSDQSIKLKDKDLKVMNNSL